MRLQKQMIGSYWEIKEDPRMSSYIAGYELEKRKLLKKLDRVSDKKKERFYVR